MSMLESSNAISNYSYRKEEQDGNKSGMVQLHE